MNLQDYLLDVHYAATRYPSAWLFPKVVWGYFPKTEEGFYQEIFFKELQKLQFKRTVWQLVFPGQNAGLIKKIPVQEDGTNEYHVRFYVDGIIHCEQEVHRFSPYHFRGTRHTDGTHILENMLNEKNRLDLQTKDRIRNLFRVKNYAELCVRK